MNTDKALDLFSPKNRPFVKRSMEHGASKDEDVYGAIGHIVNELVRDWPIAIALENRDHYWGLMYRALKAAVNTFAGENTYNTSAHPKFPNMQISFIKDGIEDFYDNGRYVQAIYHKAVDIFDRLRADRADYIHPKITPQVVRKIVLYLMNPSKSIYTVILEALHETYFYSQISDKDRIDIMCEFISRYDSLDEPESLEHHRARVVENLNTTITLQNIDDMDFQNHKRSGK